MVLLLLAALVAQTNGIKLYNHQISGLAEESIFCVMRPDSVYYINPLDVRLACSRLLGYVEIPIAACFFPLMHAFPVEVSGVSFMSIFIHEIVHI